MHANTRICAIVPKYEPMHFLHRGCLQFFVIATTSTPHSQLEVSNLIAGQGGIQLPSAMGGFVGLGVAPVVSRGNGDLENNAARTNDNSGRANTRIKAIKHNSRADA